MCGFTGKIFALPRIVVAVVYFTSTPLSPQVRFEWSKSDYVEGVNVSLVRSNEGHSYRMLSQRKFNSFKLMNS